MKKMERDSVGELYGQNATVKIKSYGSCKDLKYGSWINLFS